MTEPVKVAWIAAVATIVGALLGRPVINQIVGTADKLDHLTEANETLRSENSTLQTRVEGLEREGEVRSKDGAQVRALRTENAKLRAQIQELQRSSAGTESLAVGTTSSEPDTKASDSNEKTVNNFRFKLRGCSAEPSDIVCSFLVTNLIGDRYFELSFESHMIDSNGERHSADRIFAGGELLASYADIQTVTDVPTAFALRFPGLSRSVSAIALLEVKSKGFAAQWRNVQVGRS